MRGDAWRSCGPRQRRRCCRSDKSTWRRQRERSCSPRRSNGKRRNAAVDDATITCPTLEAVATRVGEVAERDPRRSRSPRSGRRTREAARRRAAESDATNRIVVETRTVTMRARRRRSGARRRTGRRRSPRMMDCRRSKRAGSCPRPPFRRVSRRVTRMRGTCAVAVAREVMPGEQRRAGRGGFHREAMALDRRKVVAAAGLGRDRRGVAVAVAAGLDLARGVSPGPAQSLAVAAAVVPWLVLGREGVAQVRGGVGVARDRGGAVRDHVEVDQPPAKAQRVVDQRIHGVVGQQDPEGAARAPRVIRKWFERELFCLQSTTWMIRMMITMDLII